MLIDGFLAHAPRPAFDAAAFERFVSDPRRQSLAQRVVAGEDETLHSLRRAVGATKVEVGTELARVLLVEGHENEVKARYHDLEVGAVDPREVAARVWEGLSRLFRAPVQQVRDAAATAFQNVAGANAAVFARAARGTEPEAGDVMSPSAAVGPSPVERAFFDPDGDA